MQYELLEIGRYISDDECKFHLSAFGRFCVTNVLACFTNGVVVFTQASEYKYIICQRARGDSDVTFTESLALSFLFYCTYHSPSITVN